MKDVKMWLVFPRVGSEIVEGGEGSMMVMNLEYRIVSSIIEPHEVFQFHHRPPPGATARESGDWQSAGSADSGEYFN